MSDPYIGEIRIFAGTFAPVDWAFCDGQVLPILGNEVLFALIGTTYGGDGQLNFALPDLRGRAPIHQGTGTGLPTYVIGQSVGTETVTLNATQIAAHSHAQIANTAPGNSTSVTGNVIAAPLVGATTAKAFHTSSNTTMNTANLTATGGNQPHENRQPYVCVNYVISLFGIFPSQT